MLRSIVRNQFAGRAVQNVDITIKKEVIDELIDSEEINTRNKSAKKEQEVTNQINAQLEVYNRGIQYWNALYKWALKSNVLSEKEISIVSTTLRMNSIPPTEKQCKVILGVEQKALTEGFYFNE